MGDRQRDRLLAHALTKGVMRAKELGALGIPRTQLSRLVAEGALLKVGRGAYMHPEADVCAHHSLVEVAVRAPGAVVNLLSALAFHEITDEQPHAVWIAVRRGSHSPRLSYPRLELTWTVPRFLEQGVSAHELEGVVARVTDPARTVADCFKFRRRVGLDVAIAALRDYLRTYRGGRDALWEMAAVCGVRTVIRPHMETLS